MVLRNGEELLGGGFETQAECDQKLKEMRSDPALTAGEFRGLVSDRIPRIGLRPGSHWRAAKNKSPEFVDRTSEDDHDPTADRLSAPSDLR